MSGIDRSPVIPPSRSITMGLFQGTRPIPVILGSTHHLSQDKLSHPLQYLVAGGKSCTASVQQPHCMQCSRLSEELAMILHQCLHHCSMRSSSTSMQERRQCMGRIRH